LGPVPPWGMTLRAYYVGHLGKYLPGKAWALLLRADLVRPGGVRPGLAGLTAFYEVLTTMAAGALVAAVLFACLGADAGPGLDLEALRGLARLGLPPGGVAGRWLGAGVAGLRVGGVGLAPPPAGFAPRAGGAGGPAPRARR